MAATQSSQLLSTLFEQIDPDQRLTVLNLGAALPETVDYFSRFRCKLFFADVFSELPVVMEEGGQPLKQQFTDMLEFCEGTRIDICLFWDLFNYLDRDAIAALLGALRPYLYPGSRAHGFSVHKLNTLENGRAYGIQDSGVVSIRPRVAPLPGYAPHPQSKLRDLLHCYGVERSVLLADSRLELLLRANTSVGPGTG